MKIFRTDDIFPKGFRCCLYTSAAQAKAVATVDDGSTKDGTNALNWHRQHMAEC